MEIRDLCCTDEPSPHMDTTAAIIALEDGNHTHIAFEVMGTQPAQWIPIAIVPIRDLLNLRGVRQFPVFRLAWYGQCDDEPQTSCPEQSEKL